MLSRWCWIFLVFIFLLLGFYPLQLRKSPFPITVGTIGVLTAAFHLETHYCSRWNFGECKGFLELELHPRILAWFLVCSAWFLAWSAWFFACLAWFRACLAWFFACSAWFLSNWLDSFQIGLILCLFGLCSFKVGLIPCLFGLCSFQIGFIPCLFGICSFQIVTTRVTSYNESRELVPRQRDKVCGAWRKTHSKTENPWRTTHDKTQTGTQYYVRY